MIPKTKQVIMPGWISSTQTVLSRIILNKKTQYTVLKPAKATEVIIIQNGIS